MTEVLIFAGLAAACWFGGWKFTLALFKKKEVELSGGKKAALETVSAVLLEAIAAVLALALVRTGQTDLFEAIRSELVICALLFAGLIDFKLMIIPNKLTLFLLAVCALVYGVEFVLDKSSFGIIALEALLGCAICFVIFFIGKMISRKGMGMGDIKLAAVMGFSLGMNSALACLLWAMIAASVTGIVLLVSKKMKASSKMAMAPFFFVGAVAGHIMLALGGLV